MKTLYAILIAALPLGTALAGEDSTHRFYTTGPEWHEVTSALYFQDADSDPAALINPLL